jgi:hypothetical protein
MRIKPLGVPAPRQVGTVAHSLGAAHVANVLMFLVVAHARLLCINRTPNRRHGFTKPLRSLNSGGAL